MEISTCVKYVGVNDHQVDLFEGQYKVPNGMSYNSYVILDDKIADMDTVDGFFTEEWLNKVEGVTWPGKCPIILLYSIWNGSFRQYSGFSEKISQCHSGIHS